MAPVPTPPVNVPDLSEEEAARTPNGYPNYYDKVAAEEQERREAIEGAAKAQSLAVESVGEPTDSSVDGIAVIERENADDALEPTENAVKNEGVEASILAEEAKDEAETNDDEVKDEGDNTFDFTK